MYHQLSDGRRIRLELRRSAKKNIILRPHGADSLRLSVPPWLGEADLRRWLAANEAALRRLLAQAPAAQAEVPGHIWLYGQTRTLSPHPHEGIRLEAEHIRLPESPWPQQKNRLRQYLQSQAADYLLPRLHAHAERLQLQPAAAALTSATTFWGICRHRSGIRLNWRLVGAPEYVADYVCVHELCHLPHPNHSPAFWQLVRRHTPHTDAAKAWLKQHGRELFVLD
ncbi:MAG: SprT family zinc-dependent metalloprotease [Eikenella sp.]|nr:SprT family zinc-dependent metalloprotease [Eikenella sp.]